MEIILLLVLAAGGMVLLANASRRGDRHRGRSERHSRPPFQSRDTPAQMSDSRSSTAVSARATPTRSSAEPEDEDELKTEKMFADIAAKASYRKQPVLNEVEMKLFQALLGADRRAFGLKRDIRVMPQVNMGEFVTNVYNPRRSAQFNRLAQGAVNSKRVDILITCFYGHPRVAVEFQGRHHKDDPKTKLRDEAKRSALASAGIEYVEVFPNEATDDAVKRVFHALRLAYKDAFFASGQDGGSGERSALRP